MGKRAAREEACEKEWDHLSSQGSRLPRPIAGNAASSKIAGPGYERESPREKKGRYCL